MDDVKLSTKGVTTSGLRAMIASRNADVMMSADSSYEHGWHDCADDVALPIAEERDALRAEVERLRHLRDAIIEDHEECSQYRNWLANPARVGRCHVCDLLHSEATP